MRFDDERREGPERFPKTRYSMIEALGAEDPDLRRAGFGALIEGYWKAVYKYLRVKWNADASEAEDLTQGFFAKAIERGFLERFDPAKAKFRTWLRTCLDGFVVNERKSASRAKRGGNIDHVSLDFHEAEKELGWTVVPLDTDPEQLFHREWLRTLLSGAIDDLKARSRAKGRSTAFALFQRYDLDGPNAGRKTTYAELARQFGISETKVTNDLYSMRRMFRLIVLERLRKLCITDEEYGIEALGIFGEDPL